MLAGKTLGDAMLTRFPFAGTTEPMTRSHGQAVLNRTWRPYLSVIGADGMPATLARPAGGGPHPAIVLMHERYGLVQHTKDLARRFAQADYCWVADLACGIGGDALALAALPGASEVGVDLDPLRL